MRLLRVSKKSRGLAGRLRWVLEADFNPKHGFVPHFGKPEEDAWDEAVVALEGDRLIGAVRWDKWGRGEIMAGGTWVSPDRRGQGVASALWECALRGKRTVEVSTISRGGKALIASLERRYPKVSWIKTV